VRAGESRSTRAPASRTSSPRAQLHRALLVLQAIWREAERHGYEMRAVDDESYWHRAGVGVGGSGLTTAIAACRRKFPQC
jgi:hypothetical protein